MPGKLQNKRSSTLNNPPSAGTLAAGEIALNTNADSANLHFEDAGGGVRSIGADPTAAGTYVRNVSGANEVGTWTELEIPPGTIIDTDPPVDPPDGQLFFNEDNQTLWVWSEAQSTWAPAVPQVPTGGGGDYSSAELTEKVFFINEQEINEDYTVTGTDNAGSFGPIDIANGKNVTIADGGTWTVCGGAGRSVDPAGLWSRDGSTGTLTPANPGDDIETTGDIECGSIAAQDIETTDLIAVVNPDNARMSIGQNKDGEGVTGGSHLGFWKNPGGAAIFTSGGDLRIAVDGAQAPTSNITIGSGLGGDDWLSFNSTGAAQFSGSINAAGDVITGTWDNTSTTSAGNYIGRNGNIIIQRQATEADNSVVLSSIKGTTRNFSVTNGGSGTFGVEGAPSSDEGNVELYGDVGRLQINGRVPEAGENTSSFLNFYNNNSEKFSVSKAGGVTAAGDIRTGPDYNNANLVPPNSDESAPANLVINGRAPNPAANNAIRVDDFGTSGGTTANTVFRVNYGGVMTSKVVTAYNPTSSSSGDLFIGYSDYHGSNSLEFSVTSSGTVQARDTTINQISSERRLKEDISLIDSDVAWETIKTLPFYSYKFIGADRFTYGPMADEVPAEMVLQPMEKNEEGVMVARSDEEGPLRTYDNGMLQGRLFVALQTALTRIEALEAKLTALSGPSTTDIQEGN